MTLDSSGFSDVGRYGTVYLMKKQDPATPVTAFPLDDEETTFGRDQSCSIRLYYPQVSPIHGKIYFEDRKAFLVVLGASGLFVDGCKVLPTAAGTSSQHSPRTIPLTNNTEIEIQSKRFKFTYPPKELRAALLATPAKTTQTPHRRRALRLSMIQSAQVFTPRPSPDPRENLRILQSPLRPFSSPKKPSPLQTPSDHEEEEEEIVLVDGNHPRVVEDEKDLIILEDVEVEINDVEQPQTRDVTMLAPPSQTRNPPPQTPQRRARPSLHKAVLIRSAQRAIMKAEIEREEEEEIQEVEEFATQTHSGSEESSSEEEDEDEVVEDMEPQGMTPTWRKGFDAVQRTLWPFGREPETGDFVEDHDEPQTDEAKTDNEPPRAYGNFMTPQVPRRTGDAGRLSMGGEARRVLVEQKWRVKDIEVPPPVQEIKEEDRTLDVGLSTPLGSRGRGRDRLSEQERKAIQERRRSALRTPDPFFGGQTPGIRHFPGFPASPTKPTSNPSPTKLYSPMKTIPEPKEEEEEEEEDLDTRSLLDKMKETVAEMKRRRSMAPVGLAPGTPDRKTPTMGMTPGRRALPTGGERRFSLLAPAAREEIFGNEEEDEAMRPTEDPSDEEMIDDDKENATTEPGPITSGTPMNPLRLAPKTPKMDGLRHMFAAPKPVPPTPSFVGVRDMFRTTEAPRVATPTYEGIGELIRTPVYEEPPTIVESVATDEASNPEEPSQGKQPDEEPVIEDDSPEVEEKPKAAPKSKLVKPTRISKRSTRKATSKDTPSLADDEATPGTHDGGKGDDQSEAEEDDADRLRHSKRLPRPRKVDELRQVPAAPSKPARTRQHSGDKSEGSSSGLKPRSQSKVPATRAASNEVVQPAVPPRRKATTTAAEEPLSSEVTDSAPKRRARKPTSKADEPHESLVEEHPPSSLPKATRKGRSATKSNTDTDPPTTANEAQSAIVPKRRAPPRTRAKDVIKEEDTEDSDLAKVVEPLPKRRVGRPVAASKLTSKAGTSSQKATPNASAGTGKENTPGTGDDEEDVPEKPVKPKVSRTKKVVKEEVVEEAPKRTRITRARTKT
ncbi:hypothetical protein PLEOSDRAFT_1098884 [Pleurotus ostreatus PC15]|uniref:FHA domain-containing protein n=1 Tax=Pleurotus ostreatus (strain PC15) TaxID=1137138 RepID=A0A067PAJ7_PLEO1|nr:hypothetical protein PLEOSDRAFT_1098884 [Pleurotus ostreatus PC15]